MSPRKFVQQRFRGTQIGSLEALGEAIVDLCEKLPCLAAATLGNAQARETEGGAQLPEQRFLLPCDVKRLAERIFRRRHSLTPQQNFAFDAQQLGEEQVVTVLALYRAIQSLVHGSERLVELAKPGKPRRESALELRVRHAPSGSATGVERIVQHGHALREFAPLDHQLSGEETSRGLPERRIDAVAVSIRRAMLCSAAAKSPVVGMMRHMP